MFDISPDHAIALYTGLLAIPPALFLLKVRRDGRAAPGTVLAASVLIAVPGATPLPLVWTHPAVPAPPRPFAATGGALPLPPHLFPCPRPPLPSPRPATP